jgi:F-type H+-transporting ATPase subunit c
MTDSVARKSKEVIPVMKKTFGFLLFMALLAASPALASSEAAASGGGGSQYYTIVVILASCTMVIATVFIGFAQSKALRTAVEGIARNPSASGKILPTLLIGLAMMESLAIYVLVIALILLFATPFLDLIG